MIIIGGIQMRTILLTMALVVSLLGTITGCAAPLPSPEPEPPVAPVPEAKVTGTVTYLERIALPSGAEIEVKILDVSRQDAPAVTIGEQLITTTGQQAPFSFEIEYDPATIDPRFTYAVRAGIRVDGKLKFATTNRYEVITRDNPTEVKLVLEMVSEKAPITAFAFSFDQDTEGWHGGFSDLPADYEGHGYDVEFKHSDIPIEGNENGGLSLTGNNHSDDLFMYLLRAFDVQNGLKPNTAYRVELSFDMATNVPPGMMGIGGSPGESVYIKAGVVNREPKSTVDTSRGSGIYRMDIDKGNQSSGGKDMVVVGNASKIEGPG
jgi:uncharacterized lipoprotein YbaY